MARKRKLEEDDGPPGVPKAPYGAGTALLIAGYGVAEPGSGFGSHIFEFL
jgi:hypothetical protein